MIFLIAIVIVGFVIYKLLSKDRYKASEDSFSMAGVTVVFATGKVTIKGRTYDATDITGIEHISESKVVMDVTIKVDDFEKPLHKLKITGYGAGEKFLQRFSTALRKAGGNSFY